MTSALAGKASDGWYSGYALERQVLDLDAQLAIAASAQPFLNKRTPVSQFSGTELAKLLTKINTRIVAQFGSPFSQSKAIRVAAFYGGPYLASVVQTFWRALAS